ncbi:MAG: hypothetical protein RSC72_11155 [Algoriella sp.]|uniref:hypothetical protein n=1 Tax=Algoriella sp. TaxID=1872434 RepID=UPI002FCA6F6F
MKRILLLASIFALSLTTLSSCSSDDDSSIENIEKDSELKKELIGKWRITHFYLDKSGVYVDITKPPFNENIDENYFTFNQDNSFVGTGSITSNQKGWYKDDKPNVYLYEDKNKTKGLAIIKILNNEPNNRKEVELQVGDVKQKLKITKQ